MVSVWWVWVSLGIVILLTEAMTPGGFYLFFIGVAAIIVGALDPLIGPVWIELLLFAALSTVLIVTLRKPLAERVRKDTPTADTPEFVGESARTIQLIPAGQEGSVELRGSPWKARNAGSEDLVEGASCRVTGRDGLLLIVTSSNK